MPEVPGVFPKVYHRHGMKPQELVESYIEPAEALLKRIEEDPDETVALITLSLAAAYAEGYGDGNTYGRRS